MEEQEQLNKIFATDPNKPITDGEINLLMQSPLLPTFLKYLDYHKIKIYGLVDIESEYKTVVNAVRAETESMFIGRIRDDIINRNGKI